MSDYKLIWFDSTWLMKDYNQIQHAVKLRSKGPGRKGIPPVREIIWGPINYFSYYFYIGYKGISVYRKN